MRNSHIKDRELLKEIEFQVQGLHFGVSRNEMNI
jgi:hypothetical protein